MIKKMQSNKNKKVIFIGGTSHSGSTMLDMMLGNDEHGFSVGELYALFYPYRPHHFKPQCGCGNPRCKIWQEIKKIDKHTVYEYLFKMFPEVFFIVDSSKDPWWIKEQLEVLKSKNIHTYILLIWKRPEAFAYSMLKRGKKNWLKFWINYHKLFFTLFPNFIPVSYESLVQNPSKELKRICNLIGIEYFKGKEFFWQKTHHVLFGSLSVKKYKTIYYDLNYTQCLPQSILNEIKNNRILIKITKKLENKTQNQNRSLILSPYQLKFCEIKTFIRRKLGKYLGRYVKIF